MDAPALGPLGTLWRYVRLYGYCLRFSFSRAMEFRLDFFFRIGMDALWYAVHLTFFTVIYGHTAHLGGWNFDQALIFCGTLFVADAINMTVFANNLYFLPHLINRGDLDYYLVRPVSSLFFLSLREFAANSFLNLLMALSILGWALWRYPAPLPAAHLAVYAAMLLLSVLLYAILHLLFVIPVFWLQSPTGLRDLYHGLSTTWSRPRRIYTGWLGRALVTILPFGIIVSFPTEALLEGPTLPLIAHMLAVFTAACVALTLFWRAGLRAYSSASS